MCLPAERSPECPRRRARPRRRRQGFALIIVLLLVMLMLAVAGSILLTTKSDLESASNDREGVSAFYLAEAGIAYGKEWLFPKTTASGAGAWTALLTNSATAAWKCIGPDANSNYSYGSSDPFVPYPTTQTTTGYRFCFHDNSTDPNYFTSPATGDTVDGDGIITLEVFAVGPGGSSRHLTVDVEATPGTLGGLDYAQGGGGALKQNNGDGTAINSPTTQARF